MDDHVPRDDDVPKDDAQTASDLDAPRTQVLDALLDSNDVRTSEETIELDAENFETVRENVEEKGIDCWVGTVVRDGDGRVALVQNRWSDGWILPGGNVEHGETLREAVVREVREETGLDATVERPLEVVEQTFIYDGDSSSGHFIVFEARVDDAELGDDLGVDDAEIEDAAWFAEVPADCEDADRLRDHL